MVDDETQKIINNILRKGKEQDIIKTEKEIFSLIKSIESLEKLLSEKKLILKNLNKDLEIFNLHGL